MGEGKVPLAQGTRGTGRSLPGTGPLGVTGPNTLPRTRTGVMGYACQWKVQEWIVPFHVHCSTTGFEPLIISVDYLFWGFTYLFSSRKEGVRIGLHLNSQDSNLAPLSVVCTLFCAN